MRKTNIIVLGSLNKGKTKEYSELFKEFPEIDFRSLKEIVWNPSSLDEVENSDTYEGNAYAKGKLAHLAAKVPTISDDSGLEVDALNGKPGVHSHRYAKAGANQTQDEANVKKLLEELKATSSEKRTAKFVCHICFFVEGVTLHARGELIGTIIEQPRGAAGFGYDPVFVPAGSNRTLAEMSMAEKNKISHRAVALRNLMKQIKEKNVQLVRP